MTQVNVNNFTSRQAEDFLLVDGEGYEVTVKKLENKQVFKVHAGHTQMMEIINKYNLKPKWTSWVNQTDTEGKVIPNKGKYVEVK